MPVCPRSNYINNTIIIQVWIKIGYTALHVASAWGQLNAVRSLISGGSDHSLKNQYNETARDMASRYGKLECVVYLDRSGITSSCKVYAP